MLWDLEENLARHSQIISFSDFLKYLTPSIDFPNRIKLLTGFIRINNDGFRRIYEALRRRDVTLDFEALVKHLGDSTLLHKVPEIKGVLDKNRVNQLFLIPDDGGSCLPLSKQQLKHISVGDYVQAKVLLEDKNIRAQVSKILAPNLPHKGRFHDKSSANLTAPNQDSTNAPSSQPIPAYIQREIKASLIDYSIPSSWPDDTVQAAEQIAKQIPEAEISGRVDLRHINMVTIDGEDARDFDDAVYCQAEPQGKWRLFVAIADISHYVKPGDPLDREAQKRGNSVYFPAMVIPMLPEVLANNLGSLRPHEDRLCLTCEVLISATGSIISYKFYKSLIRSRARLTYTAVAAILNGEQASSIDSDLTPHLQQLHKLYFQLSQTRKQNGSIDLDIRQSEFSYYPDGSLRDIAVLQRNDAHRIIEECMIVANICAAKLLATHNVPAPYRVHAPPSKEKWLGLLNYLQQTDNSVAYNTAPSPATYQKILASVAQQPGDFILPNMLLRSMSKSCYQIKNCGHFGLSLPAYTHFTSPIRRYPDLLVHRAIISIIHRDSASLAIRKPTELPSTTKKTGLYPYKKDQLEALSEHVSRTEISAVHATRSIENYLKCRFIQLHHDLEYQSWIVDIQPYGLFLELDGLQTHGFVHIKNLGDDWYNFDINRKCIVGQHNKRGFYLGDSLRVRVVKVNLLERKIDVQPITIKNTRTTKLNRKRNRRG